MIATFEHTTKIADALRRSLEDVKGVEIVPVYVAEMFDQKICAIEVKVKGKTVVYSPFELDNGASGIKEAKLLEIREAAGEDVASLPNRLLQVDNEPANRKHFNDIISMDAPVGSKEDLEEINLPGENPDKEDKRVTSRKLGPNPKVVDVNTAKDLDSEPNNN